MRAYRWRVAVAQLSKCASSTAGANKPAGDPLSLVRSIRKRICRVPRFEWVDEGRSTANKRAKGFNYPLTPKGKSTSASDAFKHQCKGESPVRFAITQSKAAYVRCLYRFFEQHCARRNAANPPDPVRRKRPKSLAQSCHGTRCRYGPGEEVRGPGSCQFI